MRLASAVSQSYRRTTDLTKKPHGRRHEVRLLAIPRKTEHGWQVDLEVFGYPAISLKEARLVVD